MVAVVVAEGVAVVLFVVASVVGVVVVQAVGVVVFAADVGGGLSKHKGGLINVITGILKVQKT